MATAILDDQKSLSIAFVTISDQYATLFCSEYCSHRRRPFWMTENNFRSYFSPFQINTQLSFFFWKIFTKWPPSDIMDDRKLYSIAFLAISDQYATVISQNSRRRPFWMTENHFRLHFSHFRFIRNFYFLFFFLQNFGSGICQNR